MATLAGSAGAPSFLPFSALNVGVRDVTFSASYATGGEAIPANQTGLAQVLFAIATIKTVAGSATDVYYNPATGKLQAFTAAGEVANATNLSGLVCEVVFFGRAT